MSHVAFIAPPDQIKNDRTGRMTWNGRNCTVGGADQEHDRAAAATGVGDCAITRSAGRRCPPSIWPAGGPPQFPVATLGIRLRMKPAEPLTLLFAAFNG